MSDAIRATIEIMEAPSDSIKIRSSYNLAGISFNPKELADEIQKKRADFKIKYQPDFRQAIADSWPNSIDDSCAQKDWNWKNESKLKDLVSKMLIGLSRDKEEV